LGLAAWKVDRVRDDMDVWWCAGVGVAMLFCISMFDNACFAALEIKSATGEGMDKSTLVHTQIQIIIIHFLPSPFPPIPNG
jgi:hypothetical protein